MDIVRGLTADDEGLKQLGSQSKKLLPALLRLIGEESAIANVALTSLINLCQVNPPNLLVPKALIHRAPTASMHDVHTQRGLLVVARCFLFSPDTSH